MRATISSPLRERRKAETWTALHEAAASLAVQHGIEQTTVEAIAESAGVSPRTFFNYFRAKEDAILGLHEPHVDPDELSRISPAADDLLDQVSRLLVTVVRSAFGGTDPARRRQLLVRYPNLGRHKMEQMVKAEALVCDAVAGLLAADPTWSSPAAGFGPDDTARMLVMIAGVPLRFTLTSAGFDPARGVQPEDLGPSLALLHHLQRKLS
ncbi:AcrR family transcriptional regulator [Arthrobacter sp. V4I6]|uniref:TetR/AcrR family transcriptional regulator n=1 Tax=unclassified Arthrobacter TaxID=235627 RepID=UPI00277F1614|nr:MULTISPECIES: TetR/AcrR family transcriptional regulator [unclassified Arthrobacter]MDQ0821236.1 AcrR family transcriptional regulator [Arthrobacter sp. V1I7]MDQ0855499.1 AcrR family transcriptional regulator [Arthrobacter sp. V4I6]